MLNCRIFRCSILLSLLLFGVIGSEAAQISRDQVDAYLKDANEKHWPKGSPRWQDRMFRLLEQHGDADIVARRLAREDRLSPSDEKAMMSLWMTNTALNAPKGDGVPRQPDESELRTLHQQAIDVASGSRYAPLVVEVAAQVMTAGGKCGRLESLDALLQRAPDALQAGVAAARSSECTSWWLALHARFPDNAAILTTLGRIKYEFRSWERLAFLERANASPQKARESRVSLRLDYAAELWRAGLVAEGLALVESAPAADRQLMLSDHRLPKQAMVDGVPLSLGHGDRGYSFAERGNDFRIDYVAALYLAGRSEEARQTFNRLPYAAERRFLSPCLNKNDDEPRAPNDPCNKIFTSLTWRLWLLELALNRPDEDPYLLMEKGLANTAGFGIFATTLEYDSALWVDTARRRLTGSNYDGLRRSLAETLLLQHVPVPPGEPTAAEARLDDNVRRTAAAYERKVRSALAAWNVPFEPAVQSGGRPRLTPPPLRSGIREVTLPPSLQTSRTGNAQPPDWPQDVAPLPRGFRPVRVERGQEVSVAVSLSRMLDPVGEISEGGYWIHVSQDGGKSWQSPVYTGLAQFFPYVVPSTSKLPLWAGDRLQIEVEVQQIDTSSITYPPVDLRSSRRAQNLYLDVSLAALQSDKDSDGLTDIVEERLLLDPEMADSDGDGVADGHDPMPNVKSVADARDATDPIATIVRSIYGLPEGAIVEPVDRDGNAGFLGKPAGPPSPVRPLLVQGRPEDFRVGIPGAQVFVYSDIEVQKLRAKSPDFNGLTLEAVVFNRAGDRGYVVWSFGWTGGTLRLVREPGGWRTETISNWIS